MWLLGHDTWRRAAFGCFALCACEHPYVWLLTSVLAYSARLLSHNFPITGNDIPQDEAHHDEAFEHSLDFFGSSL